MQSLLVQDMLPTSLLSGATESMAVALHAKPSTLELGISGSLAVGLRSMQADASDSVSTGPSNSAALRAAALFSRSIVLRLRLPLGLPVRADVL